MFRWSIAAFIVSVLGVTLSGHFNKQASQSFPPSNLLIREERRVVVNGVEEVWRLQWKSPPKPVCDANELWMAITCPCQGFAYGESGQLDLVRLVNGHEVDRLELTPLFDEVPTGQGMAVVQRWKPQEKDFTDLEAVGFESKAHSRPVVTIMKLEDFNHDGQATEFFLQNGTEPCGKATGIVVGLTPKKPHLHAFGTALNPDKPLTMKIWEWKALLASAHTGEILDWRCWDHGSDGETDIELSVSKGDILGIRREFSCTEAGKRDMLLSERPF